MKKSLKILSFVLATILFAKAAQSQNCDLKPEEIPDLKKMTLIVETQSEAMNTWFSEFWTFNTKIEFKTKEDIFKLKKTKNDNILVLGVFDQETHYTNQLGKQQDGPLMRLIGIVYLDDYTAVKHRNAVSKLITSVYAPYNENLEKEVLIFFKERTEMKPYEFKLSVKILANLLNAIEKDQIKNYKATKFARDQADKYCEQINSKEIFFDKDLLKNPNDINELKRNKKIKVILADAQKIAEIVDNEEDVLVTFSAPYGNLGDYLYYIKTLINAKTGVIYYESGVKHIGVWPGSSFTKSNLKDIVDCIQ